MKSLIGITQPDGRVLSAAIADDDGVADMLVRDYATATRATMLVSLGSIARLGPTPSLCTLGPDTDPVLIGDVAGFQSRTDRGGFHLFADGAWTSWSIERVEAASFEVEI